MTPSLLPSDTLPSPPDCLDRKPRRPLFLRWRERPSRGPSSTSQRGDPPPRGHTGQCLGTFPMVMTGWGAPGIECVESWGEGPPRHRPALHSKTRPVQCQQRQAEQPRKIRSSLPETTALWTGTLNRVLSGGLVFLTSLWPWKGEVGAREHAQGTRRAWGRERGSRGLAAACCWGGSIPGGRDRGDPTTPRRMSVWEVGPFSLDISLRSRFGEFSQMRAELSAALPPDYCRLHTATSPCAQVRPYFPAV